MELTQKIYENLRSRMVATIKADRIQVQARELDSERERLAGAIGVLSELYEEETGNDLQKDINTVPEWKGLMEKAQAEAQTMAVSDTQTQIGQAESKSPEVKGTAAPKLRRVAGNRQIEKTVIPAEAVVERAQTQVPKPEAVPEPHLHRDGAPMKIIIDDNPPGPNTPDKPDPR